MDLKPDAPNLDNQDPLDHTAVKNALGFATRFGGDPQAYLQACQAFADSPLLAAILQGCTETEEEGGESDLDAALNTAFAAGFILGWAAKAGGYEAEVRALLNRHQESFCEEGAAGHP